MKHILVLVDFTDTSKKALDQAISIAKYREASITICYISDSEGLEMSDELRDAFKPFAEKATEQGVEAHILVGHGNLFDEGAAIVERLKPDLVVIGTHGKKGIRQNLFGSAIFKLVTTIPASSLVVNDYSRVVEQGFQKVMMPVAPHSNYHLKVKETCGLLAKEGKIVIFAILKPGVPLDAEILNNIEETKEYLDDQGVKWEYQEVDSNRYSIGYSKETLATMRGEGMDLISIMARVSNRNQLYGKMDKENVLLNEQGIPVFCANE